MKQNKVYNICIAGIGNVGSNVLNSLHNNKNIFEKTAIKFNIIGISAKNKFKKRAINIEQYKWFDNPLDLVSLPDCDILIELIGQEKGISFDIIKKALENKIHVITANKALLAVNNTELFELAEKNNVLLLFEAAIAGGIPIVKTIKQSIFLNKINKISGILNGTTNFILTEMDEKNLTFKEALQLAQKNGYAESDPTNDIEGIDAAHKICLLSSLAFRSQINFQNVKFNGISNIDIADIKNAKKLGFKIKLVAETEIINNNLKCVVEPKFIPLSSNLSNVNNVLNAINIETDHLNPLILEGEGAGGKATASSIISDLYEIALNVNVPSLGYSTKQLIEYNNFDISDESSSFYLRILSKDIPGVLAKITSNLNEEGISIETILQIPNKDIANNTIPIIIVTHKTRKNLLIRALKKIEKLEFILENINIITIDKNID